MERHIGAMLYEPPGKRLRKPLPTIAHIHGGPFLQDAYEFDWKAQSLAAAGYLVVQPNYRGSSGRGADFSRTLYAKWAAGVQDIHAVVDYLVAERLADPKRLGIGGRSFGGINTNYAIATDTRFRAAVSEAGAANLITGYGTDQYIHDYEREVGMPWIEEDLARYIELSFSRSSTRTAFRHRRCSYAGKRTSTCRSSTQSRCTWRSGASESQRSWSFTQGSTIRALGSQLPEKTSWCDGSPGTTRT